MGYHQNMSNKKLWDKVSTEGKLDPKKHLEMMNKMIKFMSEKAKKGEDWKIRRMNWKILNPRQPYMTVGDFLIPKNHTNFTFNKVDSATKWH